MSMLIVVFNKHHTPPAERSHAALRRAAAALTLMVLVVLAPGGGPAFATDTREPFPVADAERWRVDLSGYGDLHFMWHDHALDQNRPGGARKDSRLTFDTVRFMLQLEGHAPLGFEFEAELEVEHRGAGVAMELEYEEFGEFEQEVEAGGEVILEELWLGKRFGPLRLRLGRFYIGVGLLSKISSPLRYLAVGRPESETTVVPGVWDEMGLSADLTLGCVTLTAQVVNGLDSTGFSSQQWIASGHQRRFELVSASDLAFVLRADWRPTPDILVGASAYYGNTSRNRPKADLVPSCPADDGADEVAPCGYVQGAVALLSAHVRLDLAPLFVQGAFLWGHLDNATAISERNARLSNNLDVLRSPIADEALFGWLELGLDLATFLGSSIEPGHHIQPFFRFDYYDTMSSTSSDTFDNPRFARAVYTAGLSWRYHELVFAKLDLVHRDLGAFQTSDLRDETSVRLATGFGF